MDNKQSETTLDANLIDRLIEANKEDKDDILRVLNDLVAAVNKATEEVRLLKEKGSADVAKKSPLPNINDDQYGLQLRKIQMGLDEISARKLQGFKILLFPEQDRKLFYKIVFGRWLILLAVMLLINRLCDFGVHWNDNRTKIEVQQIEQDRVNRAWKSMYNGGKKETKKLMEKAYDHVLEK